ncbi:MAG: DUF5681 domain-containing protein [Mangrovibacterium sp.]
MSFKKGESGNPNGRPKGAKDKATAGLREKIADILGEHFTSERIAADLEAMEPKDRLTFLTKLLEYTVPKLKQTEYKTDDIKGKDSPPIFQFVDFRKKNEEYEASLQKEGRPI